ncbi:MAG: hypothetical protein AAB265_08455, partial [candidate division NC10 bacterium]
LFPDSFEDSELGEIPKGWAVQPLPRSRDPRFYRYWVSETAPAVDVESICARWGGKRDDGDQIPPAGADDEVGT